MPFTSAGGVQVNFPFEPYPCQVVYMQKVIECLQKDVNGILESPTGTGKTLCLLCSCLAWLQDRKAQTELNRQVSLSSLVGNPDGMKMENIGKLSKQLEKATGSTWGGMELAVPKIIYASRTHSQLTQAVQELKKTAYNSMKVSVIGSREQMCIHEQVKKEANNTTKVHLCRAKVNARTCHYYNNLDELKKKGDPRQLVGNVADIEDLVSIGTKHRVCPYYMSRELKTDADIIFMPYNYLLDNKSRKAHGIELQGNVVIFDEAHNLEKICEESSSFDLSSTDIATAIEEVTRLAEKLIALVQSEMIASESGDTGIEPDFNLDDLLRLKATLKDLEDRLDQIDLPSNGKGLTRPGKFIFELLAQVNITFETKNMFLDLLDKVVSYLSSDSTSSGFSTKGAGLCKFADALKITFSRDIMEGVSLLSHQEMISKSYKVHIHSDDNAAKKNKKMDSWASTGKPDKTCRIISYWCFSPGHSMSDLLAHGVKCIILTSGTLSPMQSFIMEMQIPFPVQLENPHVIEKHQVWIGTLGKGPDGTTLKSNYETRFTASYQSSLGNAIVNFARVVPSGLLIFFPSYPVMEKCLEFWQENNIWNRILQYKPIFMEPRGKVAFQEAMDEFYNKINDPALNGAIFAAVCRGKVSEGLDFADNNGRAVIITGLPFPPMMDPKVILKMQFLDEAKGKPGTKTLSGREWYRQQASRAVNQAIGRVIRHKDDYGAIILCDTRFASQACIQELPAWIRPRVNNFNNFGHAIKDVMMFFKMAEKVMPAAGPPKRRREASVAGCSGAYFMPTINKGRPDAVQQAKTVIQHVPSLKKKREDEATAMRVLSLQYDSHVSSVSSSKKMGLLEALDTERQDDYLDSSLLTQPSGENTDVDRRMAESRKYPPKKKINVKRPAVWSQDTAAEKPCIEPQPVKGTHIQTAEAYIVEVKKALNIESYKIFSKALCAYKKSEDLIAVIATLADLFTSDPQHYPLMRKFYRFVRPKHKQQFHQMCVDITGEGCGYKPEHSVSKKRINSEVKSNVAENPEKKKKCVPFAENIDTKTCSMDTKSTNKCSSIAELKTVTIPSVSVIAPMNAFLTNSSSTDTETMAEKSHTGVGGVLGCSAKENSQPKNSCCKNWTEISSSSACKEMKEFDLEKQPLNDSQTDLFEDVPAPKSPPVIIKTGYSCCLCSKDAKAAFKANCDHVCCFMCWKSVFEGDKLCPECHQRVRRRHLIRLLFASGPNIEK